MSLATNFREQKIRPGAVVLCTSIKATMRKWCRYGLLVNRKQSWLAVKRGWYLGSQRVTNRELEAATLVALGFSVLG